MQRPAMAAVFEGSGGVGWDWGWEVAGPDTAVELPWGILHKGVTGLDSSFTVGIL